MTLNEQPLPETTIGYDDGQPLTLKEWLFVWGVLGGFMVLSVALLVGFGFWLAGGCQ